MSRVAVAVIGAGVIGRAHAQALMGLPRCRLAAIVDPTDAARSFAGSLDVPWFGDVATLLETAKPDAAIVATPNATHRALTITFLAAGVPVLVEKPIASTVEDAEAIVQATARTGIPVLVGHHRRHNPIIRRAKAVIEEGLLGRLTNVSILSAFFKPPEYFDLAWRRQAGGGPILINLIHEIDLVRHLCGEVVSIQAVASNAIRGFEVEDTAAVLLRLANGALVTISLSDTGVAPWSWDLSSGESANYPSQPGPVHSHFLTGTAGSLTLPTLDHWNYAGSKSWFAPISRRSLLEERGDPYAEQLRHLGRVVRGEEAPLVSAADATQTLRATLTVREAAKTGLTVAVAEGSPASGSSA